MVVRRNVSEKQDELDSLRERSRLGGGARRIEQQHAKGKLTARERIDLLLDEGSFEELDPFVLHQSTEFGLDSQRYLGRLGRHRLRTDRRSPRVPVRAGLHRDRRLAL